LIRLADKICPFFADEILGAITAYCLNDRTLRGKIYSNVVSGDWLLRLRDCDQILDSRDNAVDELNRYADAACRWFDNA